jgi:hypothetical protein
MAPPPSPKPTEAASFHNPLQAQNDRDNVPPKKIQPLELIFPRVGIDAQNSTRPAGGSVDRSFI